MTVKASLMIFGSKFKAATDQEPKNVKNGKVLTENFK